MEATPTEFRDTFVVFTIKILIVVTHENGDLRTEMLNLCLGHNNQHIGEASRDGSIIGLAFEEVSLVEGRALVDIVGVVTNVQVATVFLGKSHELVLLDGQVINEFLHVQVVGLQSLDECLAELLKGQLLVILTAVPGKSLDVIFVLHGLLCLFIRVAQGGLTVIEAHLFVLLASVIKLLIILGS